MKNPQHLLLCYSVLAFLLFQARAYELRDASKWDELNKTDSDTINATSEKCEEMLTATRQHYHNTIERLRQLLPQFTTISSLKSQVEDTVNEIALAMRTCSKNIDKQLEDLGNKYLHRLETVIHTGKSINTEVATDLEQVYHSNVDETDQLSISLRQFVAIDYNPLKKILPTMHKSFNYQSNHLGEYQKIVRNDVDALQSRMDLEINQIEKTVISVLNRFSKGMTIMKSVYASLKRNGDLPPDWSRPYIMEVLRLGTLMSRTASMDDEEMLKPRIQQEDTVPQSQMEQASNREIVTFKVDEGRSSEQDDDEEQEEDDSGCVLIFSKTKRKILKHLIVTITKIKSLQNIKAIDNQSHEILQDYKLVFHDLHLLLVSKIIDYTNNFIKLYKMTMDIMDIINTDMKVKMDTIFQDTHVDRNNHIYAEIQKFLNTNYLNNVKVEELHLQIEKSTQGAKTLKEIQKKISKELVAITTELGRDLEEMKKVIIYILEEMREGVLALKNMKENGNITGYRRLINFYDGKSDLKQLKKLIMILNMLDVNLMFDREVTEIFSSNQIHTSRSLTDKLLEEINQDSVKFDEEIDQATNITDMKRTVTKYFIDFNKMIQNYTYKVRKSFKGVVTLFVTIHEEFTILLNRQQIQNIEELENIQESTDVEAKIGLISTFMAGNAQIEVAERYGGHFNFDSSNIKESKAAMKQQMHAIIKAMESELTQLDLQIENIIDMIINEVKNIKKLKHELETNKDYTIPAGQFANLSIIFNLSNLLQVLSTQNNISKAHSQEINKTLNNAREQIQNTKGNAEQAIQECTEIGQLKVQIVEITTSVRSILLDVGSDMKENIGEISSNFKNLFESLISTFEDQQLKEKIANTEIQTEKISEQLKEYLTNRYANHILSPFSQCVSHLPHNISIDESKDIALVSLSKTIEKIEQDMNAVRKETVVAIVEKLSQGIELVEHLQSKGKAAIDEEEIGILAISNNLATMLQDFFSTDSTYNAEDMQSALNSARETITKIYSNAVTNIQSKNDEAGIQKETLNLVQVTADTYTDLCTNVRSQLQTLATTFIETYETAMSNVLGNNDKLELIMQDIMNGQISSTQNVQHENATAFIASEAFTSASEWVSTQFQTIVQNTTNNFVSVKEAAIYQLGSLHGYVENTIGNMDETIIYLIEDLKQSSTIIQLIQNDNKLDLNESQINNLSNSFQLIQLLTQSTTITSDDDNKFHNAKQVITEEFQNTMRAIEGLDDNTKIHEVTKKAVKSCTYIYGNLTSTIKKTFAQKSSDFLALYNSVKETAKYTNNVSLENILTQIANNKETLKPSQQRQELEAFINSEKFTSSTIVQKLFENQPQTEDIERLNILTKDIGTCINEMEKANQLVKTAFEAGSKILTVMENTNIVQLTDEQRTILTEAILLAEKLSSKNETNSSESESKSSESVSKSSESNSGATEDNSETLNTSIRSLNQPTLEEANAFSEAQKNILNEFDNAQKLIETATDEFSIQQTMNICIERFSTTFNNLQNTSKNDINHSCESYKNSLLNVENNIMENIQLQSALQKIIKNNEYSATFLNIDFPRISTCINNNYQSTNIVNSKYEQIHSKPNMQLDVNERSLEELRLITTDINRIMVEMEFSDNYIKQYFQQGIDILNQIEMGSIDQLSEEQIKILATNAQITQLLQVTPFISIDIPYISEARNSINNELQTTMNTIQEMTNEQHITEVAITTIRNIETTFSDLKNNFKEEVTKKLTEFKENYKFTIESCHEQANVQLEEELKNITIPKENIINNAVITEFQSYVESTIYTSTTAITDMFQIFQKEHSPIQNIKECNLNALKTINSSIDENINKMEITAAHVTDILQQGITILQSIKDGQTNELTEEQTVIIGFSNQLEKLLPQKTSPELHITDEEFIETETVIKNEFKQTITALESLSDEESINEIIAAAIQNTDSVFSTLRERVQEEIHVTVTNFEEEITMFETKVYDLDDTKVGQVDRILHDEANIHADESLIRIKNYISSNVYTSEFPVQTLFNNIQVNEELNATERSIESVKSLDNQVQDNIQIMQEVTHSILQYFEQGTKIIQTVQNDVNAEFTQEQAQVLSKCQELSEIMSPKQENLSTINEQTLKINSEEYNQAKLAINEVYEKTIKQLESLADDGAVAQVILESVNNNENTYNNLKKSAENTIAESYTKFKQIFEAASIAVEENGNVDMVNALNNLPNNLATDEKFLACESYRNSASYTSNNFVESMYQEIQNDMSPSFNNKHEQQAEKLKMMTTNLNKDIDRLHEMSTYIIQNIDSGREILQTLQNDLSTHLTEEQLQVLARSNTITSTLLTSSSTTTNQNSGWNLFDFWSNANPKLESTEIKEAIVQEYSKTVELLKTLDTEEEVQQVVTNCVTNSNTLFNNLRENIHNEITESSNTFFQNYETTMNSIYEGKNENLEKIMADLKAETYNFETAAEYTKFEIFVTSNIFTSMETIKETFALIQTETIPDTNNSITDRSIHQLGELNEKTKEYIDTMSNMNEYADNNLQKATEILNQIKSNVNIELTEEQTHALLLGQKIYNSLHPKEDMTTASNLIQMQSKNIAESQLEIDVSPTITTLNEELDASIREIESAIDKDTVQQVVTGCVQKYEEVFISLRSNVQTRISEIASNFENDYSQTLNTLQQNNNSNMVDILQNISSLQQAEENEILTKFESFINSDYYKLPNPVKITFNNLKQENIASALNNVDEKGVEELRLLNQQLTYNINIMQSTTSYAEKNLQIGTEILHSIEANAGIDLTDEQTKELALCYKITQTMKTFISENELVITSDNADTVSPNNEEIQETSIDSTAAIASIQENCEKIINTIRSTTKKAEIKAAIEDCIQTFDITYTNVKQTVQTEIDTNVTHFSDIYNAMVNESGEMAKTEGINNEIRSILQNITENSIPLDTDENFKRFNEFVHSNKFQSSTLANDIYLHIQQNEDQLSTKNDNQQAEEELTLLSTQITENIKVLEETKEYIVQNLNQGATILQTVQQNPSHPLTEENIKELSLSQTIISALSSISIMPAETQTNVSITKNETQTSLPVGESELQHSLPAKGTESEITERPVIIDAIQNQCEEAVNQIRSMHDEDSIKQIVADTVHNYDTTLNDIKQNMEQKINESTKGFKENYESTIHLGQEKENEQCKRILEGRENFVPDEKYEKFVEYVESGRYQTPPSAENICNEVIHGEEVAPSQDINERYAAELNIISTQVTQNVVEMEEITSYVTTNLEKGSVVLDIIQRDENLELTEVQIQEVSLSQRIIQVLTTTVITEEQIQEIPQSTSEEMSQPTPEKMPQPIKEKVQPFREVNFTNTELSLVEKVEECVQKINSLTDEEAIIQVVNENVQECSIMFTSLQEDVLHKIDERSTNFADTFQTTVKNLPEDSQLKRIFEEIINHNTTLSAVINTEYQQVLAQLKDETIMSSSAVENIYSSIKESNTLPAETKERSIVELESLNNKVIENIGAMKHIDNYVSTNLDAGLKILQDVDGGQQLQELNEEQIQSLTICTSITETLTTQTETSTWSTFLSYATVVIPSAEETIGKPPTESDSSLTTQGENYMNVIEESDNIIQATKAIVTTTEIQEKVIITEETYVEALQCVTRNNVTSVKARIQNSGPISVKDLLGNASITEALDIKLPSNCPDFTQNIEKYSSEDRQTLHEIDEILQVARDIIQKSVQYQQSRISLYQNVSDVLVIFVNTTELIDEVLQQLSFRISEKMLQLITPVIQQVQDSNFQQELDNIPDTLTADFINSCKILFSLMIYEETDLLFLVDEQFINAQCTSLPISKEIILEKFSKLNEFMEEILSHLYNTILMATEIVTNGKMSLQTNEKCMEIVKNIQILYDIITQI